MKTFKKEDVVGKTVIETSGSVKGKVEDVVFDLAGTITFIVKGDDGKKSEVRVAKITGISDHVVVRSEGRTDEQPFVSSPTCRYCGAAKAPDAMWCPVCGKSQA